MSHVLGWLFGGSGAVIFSALGAWIRHQYKLIKQRPSRAPEESPDSNSPAYLDPHFIEELDSAPYRAEPATEDDLRWITTKTAQLHRSHATPFENKRAWFQRNPRGFWVVRNRYGSLVGSCELIPVECSVIDDLATGKIHEKEKPAERVITYRDRSKVRCVYLENTMALLPTNEPNPWAFYAIIRAAPRIVAALGIDPQKVRIYTMSATHFYTEHGPRSSTHEKLLRRLGFEMVSDTTVQNLPLFGADLANVVSVSRELINQIESRRTFR